jgi:LacI family transcriptional regulator
MNLKDIARIEGVSITTVSRVVNNKLEGHMTIETYNKIKKIIEETKYYKTFSL